MSLRLGVINDDKFTSIFVNTYKKDTIATIIDKILNYKPKDFNLLVTLGDINSLQDTVERTVFYCKDRGEPWEACKLIIETNVSSLEDVNTDISPVDYYIVFHKGKYKIAESYTHDWYGLKQYKRCRLKR